MGHLRALNIQSTWWHVILKIQKVPKLVEATHQENIIFLENSLFSLEMLESMFQAKSRTSSCSRVGLENILKALDFA